MAEIYIANTPLILQDKAGKDFRVEAGEAVELSPEQYGEVAAHVTPTLTTGEALDAQQAEGSDGQSSEAENAPAETGKPKRGSRRATVETE